MKYLAILVVLIALVGVGFYFYPLATVIEIQERVVEKVVEKEMTWEEQLRIATEKKNAEVEALEAEKVRIAEERKAKLDAINAEYDAQRDATETRLEEIRATELSL